MRRSWIVMVAAALAAGLAASPADAQFGKLKDKLKEKAEQKADEAVDEAVDDALEGGEDAPQDDSGDPSGGEAAAGAGEATEGNDSAAAKPGEGVWVNYDYIPGDRILFFDDFAQSPVGDFPHRFEFVEGNMEVAEWQGRRWLRATSDGFVDIPLPEVLPERYTIEFTFFGQSGENTAEIYFDPADHRDQDYVTFFWYAGCGVRRNGDARAEIPVPDAYKQKPAQCRIMGDGKYLKVYVNDKRVANVPNAAYTRTNKLRFALWAADAAPLMLSDFRVAEGGKKILYDALMADGRVSTQGIFFDSGSDRLRPESTPTLTEIGRTLESHADLRLRIEGHTDDVGDDASNLQLSERRAAAVRGYLVETWKIDAGRLESQGLGETRPVAGNDTPEGRQNNRRVELVRL